MGTHIRELLDSDLAKFKINEVISVYYQSLEPMAPQIRIATFTERTPAEEFIEGKSNFFTKNEFVLTDGKKVFFFESNKSTDLCNTKENAEELYQKRIAIH